MTLLSPPGQIDVLSDKSLRKAKMQQAKDNAFNKKIVKWAKQGL